MTPTQEQKPPPEPAKAPEEAKTSSQTLATPSTDVSSTVASSTSNSQPEATLSPMKPVESTDSSKAFSEKENKPTLPPNTTLEVKSISAEETTSVPQETSESSTVPEADKDSKSNEHSEKEKSSDKSASDGLVAETVQISPNSASSKAKEQVYYFTFN